MAPKRKESNTLTKKIRSLKQLRREEKESKNHIKNVSKKILEQYYKLYNEEWQLEKINLDFKVSEKPFTPLIMNPIKELDGLNICPNTYVTLTRWDARYKEVNQKGITPEILLESIILPFFELQERDIKNIIFQKRSDKPYCYDIIDESGRVIYIKLYTKGKVKSRDTKTGALFKYLNNKNYFDELIFKEYIKQFEKRFDVLKTKISIEKSDHNPVSGKSNSNKGKELTIDLCNTPSFYGIALQYGQPGRGHSTLYPPLDGGLSKITETIIKTIPEIKFYCKSTGTEFSKIPINNKGFNKNYFNYFKKKFKKLFEKELNSPDNHSNKDKD